MVLTVTSVDESLTVHILSRNTVMSMALYPTSVVTVVKDTHSSLSRIPMKIPTPRHNVLCVNGQTAVAHSVGRAILNFTLNSMMLNH